jgi:hypothetical protein
MRLELTMELMMRIKRPVVLTCTTLACAALQLAVPLGLFARYATAEAQPSHTAATPVVAVGAQYDTTHVYVAPGDVDRFVASFLGTFGGQSTKQIVATVTPVPSSTTSQLLRTPVGNVSLFGFKTPIPFPFGAERMGYLVSDTRRLATRW